MTPRPHTRARRPLVFLAFVPVFVLAVGIGRLSANDQPPVSHSPPLDWREPPPDPPGAGVLSPRIDGQIDGSVPERLDGVGPFQHLPAQDESAAVVVAVRQEPYWKAGVLDPVLTNACRLGDFATVPLNRMIVQFEGQEGRGALQIVPPDRRHLLVDRRHLAAPKETYYFRDATASTCQVWVENLAKPRHLGPAGTSLPPADPNALKQREAEIRSWPKQ